MKQLEALAPEKVFSYFREISEIPRGSGNTQAIAQYCLDFAEKHHLKAVKDAGGNVIIYGNATEGYENCETVIIQGHMDMVCEKTPECTKDMDRDGLTLCTDGEYLWADGTTLGGDDGIALAHIFALLDSEDIPHPPIEAVITRDEETGMFGAEEFDASLVKGKTILNIDSEEEGILTVSCAGGITAHCEIPLYAPALTMPHVYEISVSGLLGGHSGVDIGKGRLNAFKMLCYPLVYTEGNPDFCIAGISGGGKMNVIPQSASIIIGTEMDCFDVLSNNIALCNQAGFGGNTDPGLLFTIQKLDASPKFYDEETSDRILDFLATAPTGVISMSESIPNMVETSLNLGVLTISDEMLSADFLIRSNTDRGKKGLMEKLDDYYRGMNASLTFSADYPAWEYRENSPLRERMIQVFREQYGRDPQVSAIHAGLECGLFAQKIADADIISFGPDIEDIHTPSERMSVQSVQRTWEYLKEVLKRCR